MSFYTKSYLKEATQIIKKLDAGNIDKMIGIIHKVRNKKGRIFFLGVGGGAGNATHAVNDFRKICAIEAYAPTDNVSELTARTNDQGWKSIFVEWLKVSNLSSDDAIFVFSVGGGSEEKDISANIVEALKFAKKQKAKILGIVGRDGGYTAKVADACLIIPPLNSATITPHTESFQALIWHLIVSHPKIKMKEMKWESVK
jgi:D-sedoheptulose 7-phosphate isomerase